MSAPLPPIVHVVDDDASFLTAISRLFRANGFSVKTIRQRMNSSHNVIQTDQAVCWQIYGCLK